MTLQQLCDNAKRLQERLAPDRHNDRMRSTNPIWRLAPVFGQLGSWNENTMLVVVGNGAAGRKSDGWSMNLRRADWRGWSFAEAEIWR
jgi:hypothetical protein